MSEKYAWAYTPETKLILVSEVYLLTELVRSGLDGIHWCRCFFIYIWTSPSARSVYKRKKNSTNKSLKFRLFDGKFLNLMVIL